MSSPLLLEIGCEEIPARMIAAAADDLRSRLLAVLDQAGLSHGAAQAWGGTRRLAVEVAAVASGLDGREETILGPPVSAAFGPDGQPTPAGAGFAKKQGIDPATLQRITTEKGSYAGFSRSVSGRSLEQVLSDALPAAVASMSFPKTMRWGDGTHRWVRPVHWIVALHGTDVIELTILGAKSGRSSAGHRFLAPLPVAIDQADRYLDALRGGRVLVDPKERRAALSVALDKAATSVGGTPVPDEALLDEMVELVEWPGVAVGRFDAAFLDLPREVLVTTLRHHQKSFSVRGPDALLPAFLAVANTDRDPAGHVRRGNEWVVVGRLEDARFFWTEDRKRTLASRGADLARVAFHKKLGSYADKAGRMAQLAEAIVAKLPLPAGDRATAVEAARLAKNDLVTGLVGEFPELQGVIGGLLLRAENADARLAGAIAEHYKPAGADDAIPAGEIGCVVAVADRLDTIAGLIRAGELPTGSRDPFALRRAASGVFRIGVERGWPLSLNDLFEVAGAAGPVNVFLAERLNNWLADRGYTSHEIEAVRRAKINAAEFDTWSLPDILKRLDAVATLRGRGDFSKLVELTKRVDNILAKQPESGGAESGYDESHPSALALGRALEARTAKILAASERNDFSGVIELIAGLAAPVATFFDDVLVLDPENPGATRARCQLLGKVLAIVTIDFDIRELAGQADVTR